MAFKNSSNQLYTKRLFYEFSSGLNDNSDTVYTLKDQDFTEEGKTFISLYRRYMELEDTTEFLFAEKYFDSYEHLLILYKTAWFRPHLDRWRNELRLKLRARAMENLKMIANDPNNKNFFEANKIIVNTGLSENKDRPKRGRPDKAEIEREVKKIAAEEAALSDDYDRVITSA